MNLSEARKLGYEGRVRSPTRTGGEWIRYTGEHILVIADLDADDWEPKPAPAEPFEAEVWLCMLTGKMWPIDQCLADANKRRIRVREVVE